MPRETLYRLVRKWEKGSIKDARDNFPFRTVLDEFFFHADWRFLDYKAYSEQGDFAIRLRNWLDNLPKEDQKKALFRLLPWINFIDSRQMQSLHADAFRRVITPWLAKSLLSRDDLLATDYEQKIRIALRKFMLLSITESFGFNDFLKANDLSGLPRPKTMGEDGCYIESILRDTNGLQTASGIIVFEEFVGTGKQASKVLRKLRGSLTPCLPILFVPLMILEKGLIKMQEDFTDIVIDPVVMIRNAAGVQKTRDPEEPQEFQLFRSLVSQTSARVIEKLDSLDDPPRDAFGYGGSGMLLITCHNAPNNTLPLIHHKSPRWYPLFRRIHHQSKDGL